VEQLAKPLTVGRVDSLQPPYSILRSAIEQEILPFCQEKGIGVVAYSPLT
jgi:aryl-alcohol dehydrogenase-like predicted oxidoreductase